MLTKAGADVDTPEIVRIIYSLEFHYLLSLQSGWTPLHAAAHTNQVEIAEMLIRSKANIEAVTEVRIIFI